MSRRMCSLALLMVAFTLAPALADEKPRQMITGEEAILAALEQKVSINFMEEPLADVAECLQENYCIQMQIDVRALDDINVGVDEPIIKSVDNVKLRSALNLVLRDLDLTWMIADEVLMITTPEEAEMNLITRVYDLGELATVHDTDGKPRQDLDTIIRVIHWTIAPETWDDFGGPGSVMPLEYRGAKVLIVRQTAQIHEQVSQLLKDLKTIADQYGDDVFPIIEPVPEVTPPDESL